MCRGGACRGSLAARAEELNQSVARAGWRGDQAASFSRALALIIAAPFSAIMIVGAFVFVELTAGMTEASMTRNASAMAKRTDKTTA